ncbi:MAG: peptidoglycan-binding protein [Actinomycetota bacterium]|nr:peptidoglycan-binding protein [Actinomycetota bacterium]
MTLIKKGAKGVKIVDIQSRLRLLGYDLGITEIDGIFGEETEMAIMEFQKNRCISVTGVIDDECWQELVDAGYSIGDRLLYLKEPPFRGDDVKILQFWLKSLGFFKNNENGIFNKSTSKALMEFQKNMKLKMDGILGGKTLEHLIGLKRIINDKQSSNYPVLKKIKKIRKNPLKIIIDYGLFPSDMNRAFGDFQKSKIDFCSKISYFCSEILKANALSVFVTSEKTGSSYPRLFSRIKKANKSKGDLLLSINISCNENEDENIFRCHYFKGIKSFSRNGKILADFLCNEFEKNMPDTTVESLGASYAILKDTNMTSVYIEAGNMNNKKMAALLAKEDFQAQTGRCIADAIIKYIRENL